jgi:MFS transporter, DHA1 family, multidrug resistance protein
MQRLVAPRGLRRAIVVMSAFAVLSDAILIAFYPQFFERRYGLTSAVHVGAYIAAISIAVMFTLPLWARVARHVETMHLLLATQCAAGVLCAASYWATSVEAYWVLSMLMFMCKSSYLLMYPYLLRLLPAEEHGQTIGLLSVVVHFGGIAGAVAGGWVMESLGPAACLWLMAAGDFAQMLVCAWLIRSGQVVRVLGTKEAAAASPPRIAPAVFKLCALVMVFDFCAYLVRPFFSLYWEQVVPSSGQAQAGLAFAIPGGVALVALVLNKRAAEAGRPLRDQVFANLLLCAAGLLLQGAPSAAAMLAGRVLFGWALFQLIVKLEVILFRHSARETYGRDFSLFNFFQNLGVLLASYAAGEIVERHGIAITFVLAAGGMALAALLERLWPELDRPAPVPPTPASSGATQHAH